MKTVRPHCWPLVPALLAALAGCAGGDSTAKPAANSSSGGWSPIGYKNETPAPPGAGANATTGGSANTSHASDAPGKPYTVINGKKAPVPSIPLGDPATIARILEQGKNHNQVMDRITYLCNDIGPRLTGSVNQQKCADWALSEFKSWGLSAELWQWGEIPVRFDRGPSTGKVVAKRGGTDEYRTLRDLQFTTAAWTAGTDGPVRGPVVKWPENDEQFEAVKDKLKGAWVLIKATQPGQRRGVIAGGGATARQRTFANIHRKWEGKPLDTSDAPPPMAPFAKDGVSGLYEGTATGGRAGADGSPVTVEIHLGESNAVTGSLGFSTFRVGAIKDGKYDPETHEAKFTIEGRGTTAYTLKIEDGKLSGVSKPEEGEPTKVTASITDPEKEKAAEAEKGPSLEERILKEGPAGFISSSSNELVRTSGSWKGLDPKEPPVDVEVQVRQSDYDYINSRLADGAPVEVEFDLPNKFTPGPIPVYDVVAEIPGTVWPDEVVVISAHMDSWNGPGSQGATDNGTGASVTLEAARILAAAHAKPERTIRFILWSGEEQGLLGSKAYVKMLKEKDQLGKISACFVDDGGTNYEGGLKCIDSQAPILEAATAPVNGVFYSEVDKKWMDVNIQPAEKVTARPPGGGGSDHQSFHEAGVPGFFWDEVGRADYQFGWHTQNDKLELAIPEYLVQSSTCAAMTAYNLACAPSLLPRQPLKKDEPKKDGAAADAGSSGTTKSGS